MPHVCLASHTAIYSMWYIVRLDSSRVTTLVKVRNATLVSSSDPTRVKSKYIPVETTILRQIERCLGYWGLPWRLFIYFIECFTTTFLRAHSWLNWFDLPWRQVLLYTLPQHPRESIPPRQVSPHHRFLNIGFILFYWMFYDHFSACSLLAKLGRWGWWWGWLERKARRH